MLPPNITGKHQDSRARINLIKNFVNILKFTPKSWAKYITTVHFLKVESYLKFNYKCCNYLNIS